ncbi:ATP-binding protein [Lapillicoccus jejuensis]|uniref:histidine kinase n=1 Tax=Lapillicoccus jejuensis TaxID=402171 RepID=A0A542E462_9MICO|nr:ATP-binding protein [Lapillicoccus jejuensis]TQJ10054.1 two-component system sensor histidine kinase KdpD [Lapillicoccus jejuensis]
MGRGLLRIYLGAAPGVGKTVAMLSEAHRRLERGADVVVGIVETHGRDYTAQQLEGLEVVPLRTLEHRGASLAELDLDAVLARRPEVVLVDELAHTNVPGSRHEKRWEDVEELLAAGIEVISTVNIQHLESLGDAVEAITGVRQRETVPDDVVRSADQLELVDMSPESLRRRMAHGNIYRAEKIDAALAHYFRPGNLSALRELALLWLADRVDETLERYRATHGISSTWPTRERVVVALTGGPEGEALLRRAARIASRGAGGELVACHVVQSDGLVETVGAVADQRKLVRELGGTFHTVAGDDVGEAILDFARGVNASQIVIGTSRHRGWRSLFARGIADAVADGSGDIDVHLVSRDDPRQPVRRPRRRSLSARRRLGGWALAAAGNLGLTLLLAPGRTTPALPLEMLVYLCLTVACALVGGVWPAVACAVASSLVINWFFTEPVGTLTISSPQNAAALLLFVVVAAAVASVVHLAARRSRQAGEAQQESRTLATLAQVLVGTSDPLATLLDQARETFAMSGAALVRRESVRDPWTLVRGVGDVDATDVERAAVRAPVDEHTELVLVGSVLPAEQRGLVGAFATQAASVLARSELEAEAAQAKGLARDNRARTALLAAVSHDLRTPLAGIKAAVSSLRQPDVTFSEEDEQELLETVEESADQLAALIANLLDMSRIQTGAITAHAEPVAVAEAVRAASAVLPDPDRVRVQVDEGCDWVVADAGLLDRVLGNVLENAVRHFPGRREVLVQVGRLQDRVQLRVVDRGPGVAEDAKERIFAPFQRVGDAPRGDGVGLGLAVSRGLAELMDGRVWAEDTPGGGLTVVLELAAAPRTAVVGSDAGAGDLTGSPA